MRPPAIRPRRRWCSCTASAARRGPGAASSNAFGDRYRAIAWDMPGYGGSAPLATVSIATLADALQDFLQASRRDQARSGRAFDRRHDRSAIAGETSRNRRALSFSPRPARRSAKPDGDWQKSFIEARLGPLDRGETLASLAPSLVKELVGDDPDAGGMEACPRLHGCRSGGELSRHHAGADGIRPAQRAEEYRGADAGAVGLEGQQCAGADDGEDGELYSVGDLC